VRQLEPVSYSQASADQEESEMRYRWMWEIARWFCALVMGGAGLGILIWLGVLLTDSVTLARHGEVRVAAVLDTAPAGKDGQYLLSFNVSGGERVLIWSSEVRRHEVGDAVTLVVDDRNHDHFLAKDRYDRSWWIFPFMLIGAAVFLTMGVWFARMDARDFHDLSYFRLGMYPPPWDPPIIRRRLVTGQTRGISVRRRGRRR
jgi:hypothetical protein